MVATQGNSPSDKSFSTSSADFLSGSPPNATCPIPCSSSQTRNGTLTPRVLESHYNGNGHSNDRDHYPTDTPDSLDTDLLHSTILKRSTEVRHIPGGSINFERFETSNISALVAFISELITRSAAANGVSIEEMRRGVKISATGGGAHRFGKLFEGELVVDVQREDEMECLIEGMKFMVTIPEEVYYFSDELIQEVTHHISRDVQNEIVSDGPATSENATPSRSAEPVLERPSPDPPRYAVTFETSEPSAHLPCLLVNIGSGVSIIKVDADGSFERVSGTSLGGGTLWGLLSLLTPARTFDGKSRTLWFDRCLIFGAEMLALSEKGDNASVDMLVGDIYGTDYSKLGLKSTMIASSFGKVFRSRAEAKEEGERGTFRAEDISRSLLYAVSNNIGQIA